MSEHEVWEVSSGKDLFNAVLAVIVAIGAVYIFFVYMYPALSATASNLWNDITGFKFSAFHVG